MAVAVMNEAPGLTTAIYDAVNEIARVESDPPAGLIVHTCGEMDGGLRIFDVWETQEDYERFAAERLGPAIEEASKQSGGPSGPPRREIYALHRFMGS
jgi:hypothetical protein